MVTYDRRTIPPILMKCRSSCISHVGIILVDNRTIASNDFGALVRALTYFWDMDFEGDWRNRVGFLPAATR